MLTAVQMLQRVRVQDNSERVGVKQTEAKENGAQGKEGTKGQTAPPSLDPPKLLAEARLWVHGNDHVRAIIDAELAKKKPAAGGTLGSTEGPVLHRDRVSALSIDKYTIAFRLARWPTLPSSATATRTSTSSFRRKRQRDCEGYRCERQMRGAMDAEVEWSISGTDRQQRIGLQPVPFDDQLTCRTRRIGA